MNVTVWVRYMYTLWIHLDHLVKSNKRDKTKITQFRSDTIVSVLENVPYVTCIYRNVSCIQLETFNLFFNFVAILNRDIQ